MELHEILALVRITIAVGQRSEKRLEQILKGALAAGVSVPVIRETILQSYLFAGYAASINAFIALNRIVPHNHEFFCDPDQSPESWRERGTVLCRTIYGNQFERLIENMDRIHPELSDWMIVEGYGKVLSRPFLTPRVRELLIVAMTAILNAERQFHSHVRGALHTGANAAELRAVFSEASVFMDAETVPHFSATLDRLLSNRKE
jgi:4-carboxymuconolactone decarboxylase